MQPGRNFGRLASSALMLLWILRMTFAAPINSHQVGAIEGLRTTPVGEKDVETFVHYATESTDEENAAAAKKTKRAESGAAEAGKAADIAASLVKRVDEGRKEDSDHEAEEVKGEEEIRIPLVEENKKRLQNRRNQRARRQRRKEKNKALKEAEERDEDNEEEIRGIPKAAGKRPEVDVSGEEDEEGEGSPDKLTQQINEAAARSEEEGAQAGSSRRKRTKHPSPESSENASPGRPGGSKHPDHGDQEEDSTAGRQDSEGDGSDEDDNEDDDNSVSRPGSPDSSDELGQDIRAAANNYKDVPWLRG